MVKVPLINMNQLFLPDIHILPNKVSLIQTRHKVGIIHWLSEEEVTEMMRKEDEKKYPEKYIEAPEIENWQKLIDDQ